VRVTPRSAREGLGGERDGALVVRVQAPPVAGAANEALVRLLGKALGVAPTCVRIGRGASGRHKLVTIVGLDAATARARLGR
jgi:uncharacterized protein YggU (UPF0235/DUF167 family)